MEDHVFCFVNCSGGCPVCSHANKGVIPLPDQHTFECYEAHVKWWQENTGHKGNGIPCCCEPVTKPSAIEIFLGASGLKESFQEDFPETTICCHCNNVARIAFVAAERGGVKYEHICKLHKNEKGAKWIHDACCVAVYFCTKCLEPTALYNQA